MGPFAVFVLNYAIPAMIVAFIVTTWPNRKVRGFVQRRFVGAPRDRVWEIYRIDLAIPESAALYRKTVEARTIGRDPEIVEQIVEQRQRDGIRRFVLHHRIAAEREPEFSATELIEVDGEPVSGQRQELTFRKAGGGTRLQLHWRGETLNWLTFMLIWLHMRRYLADLAALSERGMAGAPAKRDWRLPIPAIVSALAIGSFLLLFGWRVALILISVIAVHEFGHWLAFRVAGHPSPRVVLIPFLGGAAIGNHPPRSQFEAAFVALMGPAFSILPCVALLGGIALLIPWEITAIDGWAKLVREFDGPERYAAYLAIGVFVIGAFNLLQLVPMSPLDGGRVLQAAMHSAGAAIARWTVMAFAAVGVAGGLWLGDNLIAAAATLGLAAAWQTGSGPADVPPMGRTGHAVIGVGYLASALVFLGAVHFGLRAFDLALRFGG